MVLQVIHISDDLHSVAIKFYPTFTIRNPKRSNLFTVPQFFTLKNV